MNKVWDLMCNFSISINASLLNVTYDVTLSVDHAQVFSLLQSKESTTSASLAIICQVDRWGCAWWRMECRSLLCTTIQLETATRQQPMALPYSSRRETRCTWDSGQTPGFLIMAITTAPLLAICYSLCKWNKAQISKKKEKKGFIQETSKVGWW